MSKKHFIALANLIVNASFGVQSFSEEQIEKLADFCSAQNPSFDRQRWLEYIMAKLHPGVAVGEPR